MKITQKRNFYSNFDFFMKKFNLKKTDLEKEAGVSQGYLSRFMQKEDPDAFPSVSFLEYCSRKFEVPMDDLLNTKFPDMSPTEEYIYQFIKKVISDTTSDELLWTETEWSTIKEGIQTDLNDTWENYSIEKSEFLDHLECTPDAVEIVFHPARKIRRKCVLWSNVYSARIQEENKADLLLIPVRYPDISGLDAHVEITLWMEQGESHHRKIKCIARGAKRDFNLFYPILKRLLDTVEERQKHIQIEKGFKDVMRWYLSQIKQEDANQNSDNSSKELLGYE